jgi:hypothetical protein
MLRRGVSRSSEDSTGTLISKDQFKKVARLGFCNEPRRYP